MTKTNSRLKYGAGATALAALAVAATRQAYRKTGNTNLQKDPEGEVICIKHVPPCNSRDLDAYRQDILKSIDSDKVTWRILAYLEEGREENADAALGSVGNARDSILDIKSRISHGYALLAEFNKFFIEFTIDGKYTTSLGINMNRDKDIVLTMEDSHVMYKFYTRPRDSRCQVKNIEVTPSSNLDDGQKRFLRQFILKSACKQHEWVRKYCELTWQPDGIEFDSFVAHLYPLYRKRDRDNYMNCLLFVRLFRDDPALLLKILIPAPRVVGVQVHGRVLKAGATPPARPQAFSQLPSVESAPPTSLGRVRPSLTPLPRFGVDCLRGAHPRYLPRRWRIESYSQAQSSKHLFVADNIVIFYYIGRPG